MNYYEAMFVFDPALAAEWTAVETEVDRLLERAGATLVVCKKWDDRKLAYEIKGRRRGVYALVFFKADGEKIVGMHRDAQLSEPILRVLILRADHLTEEEMHAVEAAAPETDRDRDRDRGRGRDRDRDRDRGGRGRRSEGYRSDRGGPRDDSRGRADGESDRPRQDDAARSADAAPTSPAPESTPAETTAPSAAAEPPPAAAAE